MKTIIIAALMILSSKAMADGKAGLILLDSVSQSSTGYRGWFSADESIYKKYGVEAYGQYEDMSNEQAGTYFKVGPYYRRNEVYRFDLFLENSNSHGNTVNGYQFNDTRIGVGVEVRLWK